MMFIVTVGVVVKRIEFSQTGSMSDLTEIVKNNVYDYGKTRKLKSLASLVPPDYYVPDFVLKHFIEMKFIDERLSESFPRGPRVKYFYLTP